jgi:hypothetical protein
VKSTVSGVFEDFKFKISEGYMGEGRVKKLVKLVTSFMDGRYLDLDIKINSDAATELIFRPQFHEMFSFNNSSYFHMIKRKL